MFDFRFPEPGTVEIYGSCGLLFRHSRSFPSLFLGRGKETIRMFRGNFDISDRVSERFGLFFSGEDEENGKHILRFTHPCLQGEYQLTVKEQDSMLYLEGSSSDASYNRLWLRLVAEKGEHVVGGGEQFSALDLRGKLWPIWTREQGVGRNKLTEVTRLADALDGSGGDYHTTFFPQPTFLSSRMYFTHVRNYEYAELDFREDTFHEISLWCTDISLTLSCRDSFPALLEALTGLLGRQLPLPDWCMKGLWLGVQGGTKRAVDLENRCKEGGMDISAVWIQDWEGKRVTSFGSRLQWDWRWNR